MAAVETTTFPVQGFHCSGCADKLGQTLRLLEGVIRADADYDSAQVQVRFDPARVTDADIDEGIRAAGFEPAWARTSVRPPAPASVGGLRPHGSGGIPDER